MTDESECLMSVAFSEIENEAHDEQSQLIPLTTLPRAEDASPMTQPSAFQTTLGVASSAANFVLYPYVAAGKAAVHVTSMAVSAPFQLSNRVRTSFAQTWAPSPQDHDEEDKTDLFGERSSTSSCSSLCSDNEHMVDLIEQQDEPHDSSRMSSLLYLPVRLVHSSVSTAVAIPTRVVTYSGQKISGVVSTSHQLATSAVVASTEAVTRTGMHVAKGISQGAVSTVAFTAATLSGAVGASIRTVSYAIPPSVSNAMWQGIDISGNASVNVLSHAIAVPSYRMLKALFPAVETCFSEEEAVAETRSTVKILVKVLGPQNAIYLLKWLYETVNSDEALDAFFLCRDILNESLNGDNYRHAGASVKAATGFTKVVNVMQEAYSVLPSLDELLDTAVLLADVSDEVVDGVGYVASGARDLQAHDKTSGDENGSRFEFVDDEHDSVFFTDTTFERERREVSSDEELNPILDSSMSLLTRICDSEEATSLFNTFGDFLDTLID